MHGKPLIKSAVVKCPLGTFRGKVTLTKTLRKRNEEFKYYGVGLFLLIALVSLKGE